MRLAATLPLQGAGTLLDAAAINRGLLALAIWLVWKARRL